jgi:DNA-directed RNA polymerase specialized sigma24 family protein
MSGIAGMTPNATWFESPKIEWLVRRKAYELIRKPGFHRQDLEDIEHDLFLHLLSKSALFDPARATPWTFASRLIENKAASMIRKANAKKRSYHLHETSINEPIRNCKGKEVELAAIVDESMGRRHTGQRRRSEAELIQLRMDVAEANQALPSPLREVAALLSHVSEFAASEVLGVSRRQTAEHVAALRALYDDRGLVA